MTVGQWEVRGGSYGLPNIWNAEGTECVAERVFNRNEKPIAAVPDLMAAVRTLAELIDRGETNLSTRAWALEIANAAMQKAGSDLFGK